MTDVSVKSLDTVSGKILDVLVSEFGVAAVVAHAQRPVVKKRPVVRKTAVVPAAQAAPPDAAAVLIAPMQTLSLGAPALPVPSVTPALSTQISVAGSVAKKAIATIPRCTARIYGDKILIPGTKNVHGFKHAQCERNGSLRFARNEDDTTHAFTEVASTYELKETESNIYLCKVCKNRWEKRTEKPDNWHGIFDCDDIPATSHFIGPGSSWYTKYATMAAKATAAAAGAGATATEKIELADPAKTS